MFIIFFILALSLPSVNGLAPINRSGNTTVTTEGGLVTEAFATAAEVPSTDVVQSITASHTSSTLLYPTWTDVAAAVAAAADFLVYAESVQFLLPPVTQSFHTAATRPSIKDTSAGSIDGEMATPSVRSHTMQSIPAVAKDSSATPEPTSGTIELCLGLPSRTATPKPLTDTNELHSELHKSKATPVYGNSTSMPSLAIETQPGLIFGTQTITPNIKSQYILPASQTFSLGSIVTLGSGTSTTISALQTFLVSGSRTLLLSPTTATPEPSKQPCPLTISDHIVKTDSLSRYLIDGQTLTPSGVITVSGTAISLAPSASGTIVGNSTKASGSITTQVGSVSNRKEVQKSRGNALGVRDELRSSLVVLLTGTALLLWL